jgi:hypothetical protein
MNEKRKCNGNSHICIYRKGLVKTSVFSHNMQRKSWLSILLCFFFSFPFGSFMFLLAGFDKRVMQVCGDIMSSGACESFPVPLMRRQTQLLISFGATCLLSMKDCALVHFFY